MASPSIGIRMIRSDMRKTLLARYHDAYEEVKAAIDNEVKARAIAQANDIVDNWEHKPAFVASFYAGEDKISLYVEPVGPNAKYWDWTSRGTKPHMIKAGTRFFGGLKTTLRFQANYKPKTTPGPTWSGPGTKSGPWISKKTVHHPGTEPRKFEEYIAKQIKTDFRREIENAFRRGLRRAGV